MNQKYFRILRIILSVVFILLISALFIDFREFIPTVWADRVLFLQFMPSLIKFITVPAIAATGFLFIIILTALFGRVYCSTICPLGVLQDFFARISKGLGLIKRYKFKKALNYLRYPIMALTIVFVLFGSLFIVNLLDPYSSFGRIFSDLVRPGIIVINNVLAGLFEKFNMYFLARFNLELITWKTVFIPSITLAFIIWLSIYFGRLYCNAICPVGTLLGLLSRLSFFKIKMDTGTCTKCGKCSFACKSSCINVKEQKVDFSRCVACYNCISVCPEGSINYVRSFRDSNKPTITDTSKREFLSKTVLYGATLAGLSGSSLVNGQTERPAGKIPNKKTHPISPPGSISLKHFTDRCTACHLCVSSCPTSVLQPSFLEYGFTGMMQPQMDYAVEYCNFECTKCGEVCPTGAILPLTIEDKKLTQMGQVNFNREKCIVYTDNTACGSCSEHCPTQAVKMVPYKEGLTIPETRTDICIGCGACEFACPVKPYTAIYVNGNEIHKVAEAPQMEELMDESGEEFPF